MTLPILYSFRRCPYAMRARLALMHCGAQCELREVVLKDKPAQLLQVSSKGTVPVLLLPSKDPLSSEPTSDDSESHTDTDKCRVIDESIDIMRWALTENPARDKTHTQEWQITETLTNDAINALIDQNDGEFKAQLDKYKYSDHHPEHSQAYYLDQALPFLETLENLLSHSTYLTGEQFRFIDAAILPFIRQFSMVDSKTFKALPLPNLQHWLSEGLISDLFLSVMHKHPPWKANSEEAPIMFGKP